MAVSDLMQQIEETERLIAVYRNANEVIVGTQDEVYSILESRLAAMRAELQKLGVEYQWEANDRPCRTDGRSQVRRRLAAGGSRIRTLGPSYEEPRFPGPRSWTAFNLGGARVFGTATPYP